MTELPPRKAVLIDDEGHIRTLMSSVLRAQGFEVVAQLESGEDTARIVEERGASLVLLDVNMPGKNGPTILKEIFTRCQPCVIMLTAVKDSQIIDECLNIGAAHYILKSGSMNDIKQIIETSWQEYYSNA